MKPGVYRLTQDVVNPTPDRRKVDWRFHEKWAAGTTAYLTMDEFGSREVLSMVLAPRGAGDQRGQRWFDVPSVRPNGNDSRGHWDLIAPHLEGPLEMNYMRLLRFNHYNRGPGAKALLSRLVDEGHVSLDTLIGYSGIEEK